MVPEQKGSLFDIGFHVAHRFILNYTVHEFGPVILNFGFEDCLDVVQFHV